MSDKIKEAMETIKQAMVDDNPGEPGSYAHSWHCNIAMMCYDAIKSADINHMDSYDGEMEHEDAHKIGNDAASRFMKLCFDVETKA